MIHVLHVGKTGGTAVKAALQPHADKFYFHRHTVRLCDCPEGELVFCAVRDPLERYVSAFNSRLRKGAPRYLYEWSADEADAFRHFTTPNDLGEALSSLNPLRRRRAHHAMLSIRHVRSKLSFWLGSAAYLRSRSDDLVIGETRTLQSDFDRLLTLAGLDPIVLSTDPVIMHRTPGDMDRHLSPTAKSNLSGWYAEDFALYDLATALRQQGATAASDEQSIMRFRPPRSSGPATTADTVGISADLPLTNNPC